MILNVHPIAVHFPIALWVCAFLFEIGSLLFKNDQWHQTANHMYTLAVWLTPIAVITGLLEQNRHHLSHPVVNAHKNLALLAMFFGLSSWFILERIRKHNTKLYRWFFVGTLFLVGGLILTAGFFGGRLVYEYGIGVQ